MLFRNFSTESFLRFSKFLLRYPWQFLATIGLSGLVGLLSLINPWLTKLILDRAIGDRDSILFMILVVIGGLVFVLTALVNAFKSFLDHSLKLKIGADINRAVYAKIQGFPIAWFAARTSSEHVYKLNYDVAMVKDSITTIPVEAVLIFPQTILTLVIIAGFDWKIAVLVVVLVPVLYLPYYYFNQQLHKSWSAMVQSHESLFKDQQESVSHVKLVKVFHQKEQCLQRYSRQLLENLNISIKNALLEAKNSFCSQVISKVLLGVIGCYGAFQVIQGGMTIGTLTAIAVYLTQLVGLQSKFFMFFQTMIKSGISCERLSAILDSSEFVSESPEAVEVSFRSPGIIFKNVSFWYSKDVPVLSQMNFAIKGGACVALVGPSGCGKSTLVGLLLRLYDPCEGEITFDGHPLNHLKRASVMGQMGVALQESLLWNNTLRHNISYGCNDATEAELSFCARIVGADLFIQHLPLGLDTMIGENACRLSEGQKQRIALARALIRKPRILILDEAMSSLDSESEAMIFANIRKYYPGTTLVYVSHRLSMMMKADMVYYMKSPTVIVIDEPDALWARDENFRALFSDQKMV